MNFDTDQFDESVCSRFADADPKSKKNSRDRRGNVAMDAARCARRLGSEVHIVYRRSLEELPARKEEVEHAMEEGIILIYYATQFK